MESRAADQSHLNIETVSNVYLLCWELRENESRVNKRAGIIRGRVNRRQIRGRINVVMQLCSYVGVYVQILSINSLFLKH